MMRLVVGPDVLVAKKVAKNYVTGARETMSKGLTIYLSKSHVEGVADLGGNGLSYRLDQW